METSLVLPIVDISSPDKITTARLIRRACVEHGFFYVKNHGIPEELMEGVFRESKRFFNLPLEDKMDSLHRDFLGYTPLYAEKLDTSLTTIGDSKESFFLGSSEGVRGQRYPNQWPSENLLPSWRQTMECYYKNVIKLLGLVALALDLDEDFFIKIGALNDPAAVVRLIRYPGEVISSDVETYGASAHSDYGTVTLLLTDEVPGLQVCRDKSKQPRIWEDVPRLRGAFIVNIGDLMERWTNGLFRSTLHRVMPVGKERYSVAFFLDPNPDCNVECLKTCCSETSPARYLRKLYRGHDGFLCYHSQKQLLRFPPILAGDYIKERFRITYAT
ncbi:PREDICTED: 1-aminocyclopropane-1-carboxylate oxidase-like isoform X2 [Brassica oleracea var. oleracea]|uniref:1-aminocyclopropane-1-carboxylate oxidase-like isoform X2 n=1 Tax=Brassica oleracea var. oleracea TaxID=109376 RepID=UPI0006A711D7|nr:PREDICTED: 1-aminocyclopropane-1-carboxylate oxidase-like isoform X2 [Brassica oleracea var. oleracea]